MKWREMYRLSVGILSATVLLWFSPECAWARPNIVVIMTDDQDAAIVEHMPNVQKLAAEGLTFVNSFASFPLCAPSRATFFTGQAPHNHGVVTDEEGYAAFAPREANSLGPWLASAGYETALFGKFLNKYGEEPGTETHVP